MTEVEVAELFLRVGIREIARKRMNATDARYSSKVVTGDGECSRVLLTLRWSMMMMSASTQRSTLSIGLTN